MEREVVLRVISMPSDADATGQVSVGWLLGKLDIAGAVIPSRLLQEPVRLKHLNAFEIHSVPHLGGRVSFYARQLRMDSRQVEVELEVRSERRDSSDETKLLVAALTYSAAG